MERIPVPGEEQLEETLLRPLEPSPWKWVILACTVGTLVQLFFVACACQVGQTKMLALLLGNGLILVRALFGHLRNEASPAWMMYLLVSLSLGGFFSVLAWLAGGH